VTDAVEKVLVTVDQSQLFYLLNLEGRIPVRHLLRRINPIVTRILAELRSQLEPFYSEIGRPSIDPELMIRMLIVAYCYGIRSERKLREEVDLHLAYRWFCRLDLDDKVPDHSTFSVNRHGRFRKSDILRQVFEAVVQAWMDADSLRPRRCPGIGPLSQSHSGAVSILLAHVWPIPLCGSRLDGVRVGDHQSVGFQRAIDNMARNHSDAEQSVCRVVWSCSVSSFRQKCSMLSREMVIQRQRSVGGEFPRTGSALRAWNSW
jgi:transposase